MRLILCIAALSTLAFAQEVTPAPTTAIIPVEMNALEKDFQAAMTNVTLTGFFTVADTNDGSRNMEKEPDMSMRWDGSVTNGTGTDR